MMKNYMPHKQNKNKGNKKFMGKKTLILLFAAFITLTLLAAACTTATENINKNTVIEKNYQEETSTMGVKTLTTHAPIIISGNPDFSDADDDDGVSNPRAAGKGRGTE